MAVGSQLTGPKEPNTRIASVRKLDPLVLERVADLFSGTVARGGRSPTDTALERGASRVHRDVTPTERGAAYPLGAYGSSLRGCHDGKEHELRSYPDCTYAMTLPRTLSITVWLKPSDDDTR
jgi:hypothetical protein